LKPGFVYLFLSIRFGYFKIGLSGTPKVRLHNIRKTVKEELNKWPVIVPVAVIAVWNMESVEEKIHTVLKPWNFTWVGSGKTEWHRIGVLFFGLVLAFVLLILFQLETITRILVFAAVIVAVVLMLT
jgi:hypothetical protein